MGFLDAISGNATEVSDKDLEKEMSRVLVVGESIEQAFKVFRDLYVFTSSRLILVDKQGLSGKKVEYLSIPYRSITRFSVETAGSFDRDSELKLWVSGDHSPIKKEFRKGTDVVGLQRTLATHVLR